MKRDIADATSLYPIVISAKPFKNMHNVLLQTLNKFFDDKNKNSLLILGLSPIFSPFADERFCLEKIAKNEGNVVGVDYNLNVIEECFIYLHKLGFYNIFNPKIIKKNEFSNDFVDYLKKNNFSVDDILEKYKSIKSKRTEKNTILFIERDLKDGLSFQRNSFDFIDATLTLHHVAAYQEKYLSLLKEIYDILKPNGIFHLGEGFVDMRGSEKRIDEIANSLNKKNVVVEDKRDPTNSVYLKYTKKGKRFLDVIPKKIDISIDENGIVKINQYNKKFPLMSEKDEGHYRSINNFYDFSIKEIKAVQHPSAIKAAERAEEERRYALAGLVEYYSSLRFYKKMLKRAGFNVKVVRPNLYLRNLAEFGNLICKKRLND